VSSFITTTLDHIFDDSAKIARAWLGNFNPSYSPPDIAPSDYHLFRSIQNSLNGVKLASKEACENHLKQFFNQKPQKFYRDGIMALPQKWQNIIENNGAYLV